MHPQNRRCRRAAAPPAFDPATAGSVMGMITLEGTPPAAETIRMNSDPRMRRAGVRHRDRVLRGRAAAAAWAMCLSTSRKASRAGAFPVPDEPAMIDQVGCRYTPHVFGMRVGQTLKIRNSDATPAQHSRHTGRQPRIQHGARPIQGMEFDSDVRSGRGDGAVQVRRARLDERLRRRAGSPLLRGDRRRREFRYQRAPRPATTWWKRGTRSSARRRRT